MRESVHMYQEWKKIYGDRFEEGDDGGDEAHFQH
jgi:hypothetical protein